MNKFQHNGFYALHILQNHEQSKLKNNQNKQANQSKANVSNISNTAEGHISGSIANNLSYKNINSSRNISQSHTNSRNGPRANSQKGQKYVDYITEQANTYREKKTNQKPETKQPSTQRSPKQSNYSVWSSKENRFDWIGKDSNVHFKQIDGQLKSYYDLPNNQSSQSSTYGIWQNLINKTSEQEQYQKKRSASREGQQNQNSHRVMHPDQQETPRFNPCFKSVFMKEQINPQKLEEQSRERKIQKKYEQNLEQYDRLKKGIVPDTAGREIPITRRKSTENKKKYDYSSQVVLSTEENTLQRKQSVSKVRQMYEEAYDNNMNSVIFQTDVSQNNDSVLIKKLPLSKNMQSLSNLNSIVNNKDNNKSDISSQVNSNNSNVINQQPLKETNLYTKTQKSQINTQQNQMNSINKNILIEDNNSVYNSKAQSQQQSKYNTRDTNDKENKSNNFVKIKDSISHMSGKNSINENTKDTKTLQNGVTLRTQKYLIDKEQNSQQQNIESARTNPQNRVEDIQFNQLKRQRSTKRRSSQSEVFRIGDRLWTDVRESNYEELNRIPSRERLKTNPTDRQLYQGDQEFWVGQRQDNIWKEEVKQKEIQSNNVVLQQNKIGSQSHRSNSISNYNTLNNKQIDTNKQSQCNTPYSQRINNFISNDKTPKQYESYIRENSRSCTPKQYDYSPSQKVQTAGDINSSKVERDVTPKQFQNVDFSQARQTHSKMFKSQIKF